MKYDSSLTDTSSYQSYETSTTSSDLAGEKEKKLDESMDSRSRGSNIEQHTKLKDVTNGISGAGIAGAGIATSNITKPRIESEKLPNQAYVEPDSVAKTSVGSPAGDSTYASPRANTASPLGNHGTSETQAPGSIIAGQVIDGASATQTDDKDNSVGLPGSSQDDKMIGLNEQPTNDDSGTTNENVQPTNVTRETTVDDKTSLLGGSRDHKPREMLENDGNYDKGSNDNVTNSNTGDVSTSEAHAVPSVSENTSVPEQVSTDAIQPNLNNNNNAQYVSASVQAPAPDPIPALAQDPISLPTQAESLNFAGHPENDKFVSNPQGITGQATQVDNGITQPAFDQTVAQPAPIVKDTARGTNDTILPMPNQDSLYGTEFPKNLNGEDATFGINDQAVNNIGSSPSQPFDSNGPARNTPSTMTESGHVVEDSYAKPGDQAEHSQGVSGGHGKDEAAPQNN